ncbi:hypothetical protein ACEQ8H_005703 [Pleosporales sp. CAS-2024a]
MRFYVRRRLGMWIGGKKDFAEWLEECELKSRLSIVDSNTTSLLFLFPTIATTESSAIGNDFVDLVHAPRKITVASNDRESTVILPGKGPETTSLSLLSTAHGYHSQLVDAKPFIPLMLAGKALGTLDFSALKGEIYSYLYNDEA